MSSPSMRHYRDTRINDPETLSEVRDIEADEDLITREPCLLMITTVGREECWRESTGLG